MTSSEERTSAEAEVPHREGTDGFLVAKGDFRPLAIGGNELMYGAKNDLAPRAASESSTNDSKPNPTPPSGSTLGLQQPREDSDLNLNNRL